MPRPYCPEPDNCKAPKRGVCMCQDDALAKMREARLGRKHSPETIAKMREGLKRHWKSRGIPIPNHLKSYARKLRQSGISGEELRKALEAAP